MGCELINYDRVANVSCLLKPTRDGSGKFTGGLNIIKASRDIWIEIKVFYRNSALRLIPFFQSFNYDVCGLIDGLEMDFFGRFFYNELKKQYPDFLKPCPYIGRLELKEINFCDMLENALVDLVPKATYKLIIRFYGKEGNITYLQFYALGDVRAVNVMHEFQWIQAGRTVYV